MQSIKLNSHVGSDGILHLDVPVNIKNAELEVLITVKNINSTQENERKSEWSPEFFEKTAGAWEGEPLEREPQGEYENREELF
ncbi:hypothetical protein Sta7437_2875 [Stanieria cyanosphaera PCC 7437]|uniref:Uncharacterized protein n=1 Tax=Stanieria cyanosphaera (strain ATCC 29371 / PCC 7437) TaxID=111780 RepID=K9XUW8_STAC7|nr:hypothetical protein [Stanieria cyanosphaera]AFZ36395.1 hypothetical protein Sta7437_2875 [Stanieria cyanosphaera PCC 7437]